MQPHDLNGYFRTSIIIQALQKTFGTFWLTELNRTNWLQWNPAITKIEGKIAVGEKVTEQFMQR